MASDQYAVFRVSTEDGSFVTLELPDYVICFPFCSLSLWLVRIPTRHTFVQETYRNEPKLLLFYHPNSS